MFLTDWRLALFRLPDRMLGMVRLPGSEDWASNWITLA